MSGLVLISAVCLQCFADRNGKRIHFNSHVLNVIMSKAEKQCVNIMYNRYTDVGDEGVNVFLTDMMYHIIHVMDVQGAVMTCSFSHTNK